MLTSTIALIKVFSEPLPRQKLSNSLSRRCGESSFCEIYPKLETMRAYAPGKSLWSDIIQYPELARATPKASRLRHQDLDRKAGSTVLDGTRWWLARPLMVLRREQGQNAISGNHQCSSRCHIFPMRLQIEGGGISSKSGLLSFRNEVAPNP